MIIEQKQKATPPTPAKRGRKDKSTNAKGARGGYRGECEISPIRVIEKTKSITPYRHKDGTITKASIQRILAALSQGEEIESIAKNNCVHFATIYKWIAANKHHAGEVYSGARQLRAEKMAARIRSIAENCDTDRGAIDKARMQIDCFKWFLSKNYPEKYGDLQRLELSGRGGAPLQLHAIGAAAIADAEKLRQMLFGGASANSGAPEVIDAEVIDE